MALCRSGCAGKPATTTAYPTFCSGSRATFYDGIIGERHLGSIDPLLVEPLLGGRSTSPDDQLSVVRTRIRERRRRLSEAERRAAEQQAARRLGKLWVVLRARRMAVYLPIRGEMGLDEVIADAEARSTLIYAPVVDGDSLRFALLGPDTTLRNNYLGIPEPANGRYIDPRHLDVVLTPLVAFDDLGTRVGMGGGHYDRSFGFLASRGRWRRPKLIGVGYEFQRLRNLERRSWDVPLWAAVTERDVYRF